MTINPHNLRILQVNTSDGGGGAEGSALRLFRAYTELGCESYLAVGTKYGSEENIFTIRGVFRNSNDGTSVNEGKMLFPGNNDMIRLWRALFMHLVGRRGQDFGRKVKKRVYAASGVEDMHFPETWSLLKLIKHRPDILHCHNLHGGFFDLRALPWLSHNVPVILNLRDCWLLSGHCAHSFDCEKWKTGCGECPDLSIYPSIGRDATAFNWRRKKQIFAQCRFYITAPSAWVLKRVDQSILARSTALKRVIPNSVDVSIFKPTSDMLLIRKKIDLPLDARIVMCAANAIKQNTFKDLRTMKTAIGIAAERMKQGRLIFLGVGQRAEEERIGNATIRFIPYVKDPKLLAQYYQASDIYIHAALGETFSNTILEARACGTPVVATHTGGLPEQIMHGITGLLVAQGDAIAMADYILKLLENDSLRIRIGKAGAKDARERFSIERQVNQFMEWYSEVIDDWSLWKSKDWPRCPGRESPSGSDVHDQH